MKKLLVLSASLLLTGCGMYMNKTNDAAYACIQQGGTAKPVYSFAGTLNGFECVDVRSAK